MDNSHFPQHIGIIMDGNRRWAKSRILPIKLGHRQGAETLKKIVRYANKIGVKYLTVFAFSTENWKRSDEEVEALMNLLQGYLDDFTKEADTENIVIRVLGDVARLSENLQKGIASSIERTKNNTGIVFNIALNYGGRAEMVKAVKEISEEVRNGKLELEDITEEMISNHLYTAKQPDPDLIIRTSGEMRLSGFLMWQSTYSEILFLDKYWPDFSEKDLDEAIQNYSQRKRNLGK